MTIDGKAVLEGISSEKKEMEARIGRLIAAEVAQFRERTGVSVSGIDIDFAIHRGADCNLGILTGVSVSILLP